MPCFLPCFWLVPCISQVPLPHLAAAHCHLGQGGNCAGCMLPPQACPRFWGAGWSVYGKSSNVILQRHFQPPSWLWRVCSEILFLLFSSVLVLSGRASKGNAASPAMTCGTSPMWAAPGREVFGGTWRHHQMSFQSLPPECTWNHSQHPECQKHYRESLFVIEVLTTG